MGRDENLRVIFAGSATFTGTYGYLSSDDDDDDEVSNGGEDSIRHRACTDLYACLPNRPRSI